VIDPKKPNIAFLNEGISPALRSISVMLVAAMAFAPEGLRDTYCFTVSLLVSSSRFQVSGDGMRY
jgi:hypothetical protein